CIDHIHRSKTSYVLIMVTTTKIFTLSLHDALPIWMALSDLCDRLRADTGIQLVAGKSVADEKVTVFCEKQPLREMMRQLSRPFGDRKSTRLNSSHDQISYAVFCLKKKN